MKNTATFADGLTQAILEKGTPTVVALDPVIDQLPVGFQPTVPSDHAEYSRAAVAAIREFSAQTLQVLAAHQAVVKINSAYFERFAGPGLDAYFDLVQIARRSGLFVIGDVKRGDVGHTADQYAAGHLASPSRPSSGNLKDQFPDAITINGYFGWDGVAPFAQIAKSQAKGVFVLVRTSNPSAAAIQDLVLADGRKVHEAVADEVTRWNLESDSIGRFGFGPIGAVVATRNASDAARLRSALPHSILLVPGYGAQGGRAEDFAPYFRADGTGALVAAGRSVIFAHTRPSYRDQFGDDWKRCLDAACREFVCDLGRVWRREA